MCASHPVEAEAGKRRILGVDSLDDGTVSRRPFWLDSDAVPVAAWLHHPRSDVVRRGGVLLCPSLGHEYTHAHRTLVHLADELAKSGFIAMRIDYPGTGDSGGDETLPDLVGHWGRSIDHAAQVLESFTSAPPSLVGLRLGGTLGFLASARRSFKGLVLWAPVNSGRRFARELRALARVSLPDDGGTGDFLEAGGFRYADETVRAIAAMDLASTTPRIQSALEITPHGDSAPDGTRKRLADLGIPASTVEQSDYEAMMAEPQFTSLPKDTIASVVQWLGDLHGQERVSANWHAVTEAAAARSRPTQISDPTFGEPAEVRETFVLIPASKAALFGVLTEPTIADPVSRPIAVLANAGSVHHVGPNRLYVELARQLAQAGFASLRIDLRSLGDSRTESSPEENHPYPSTAVSDVRTAVQWLVNQGGFRTCALAGLCSGAHTSFHAGHELIRDPISHVICINPLTFSFVLGMSLGTPASQQTVRDARYYAAAMKDPQRWRRLIRGQSDIGHITRFLMRRALMRADDGRRAIREVIGLVPRTRLEENLAAIVSSGRNIGFVFSTSDPGQELLMREAGRTVRRLRKAGSVSIQSITDADHTFSRKAARDQAIAMVTRDLELGPPSIALRRELLPADSSTWQDIRPIWSALLARNNESSAFVSTEWIEACLRHAPIEATGSWVVWRSEEEEPVGCALLWTGSGRIGPLTISRDLLNSPDVGGLGAEYNDIVADPRYRTAIVGDLVALLAKRNAGEVVLQGVRERLFQGIQAGWARQYWNGYQSESPYVDLDKVRDSGSDYLAHLSSNTRSQIRRSHRGYTERFGDADLTVAKSPDEGAAWFDELLQLHDTHWIQRGIPSGFTVAGRNFHKELIRTSMASEEAGSLSVDLTRVRFGKKVVGYLYHLVYRDCLYFIQSGMAYHDDNRLKPGLVCHALSVQRCLERGYHSYDFLGGEPHAVRYKRSMSTDRNILYWAQLPAPTLTMDLLEGLRRARRQLRAIRNSASS